MSRPDWQGWAAAHDLTFEEEAPQLVGVWLPPYDGAVEKYTYVVAGKWRGFEFTAFTHSKHRNRRSRWGSIGYLFLRLPGGLPPEIAAMDPAEAFKLLGGDIPSSFDFIFRPPDYLGGRTPSMNPGLLEGALQDLTLQVEAAPPELWQH